MTMVLLLPHLPTSQECPICDIRVVTLENNLGKGGAVHHGMLCVVDADGASRFDDLEFLWRTMYDIATDWCRGGGCRELCTSCQNGHGSGGCTPWCQTCLRYLMQFQAVLTLRIAADIFSPAPTDMDL
ncbi:hypothetical protein EV421DRAFT_1767517 [Armillaria borealis]|uniref:Uncharacterized protein n=1 Tax=Armillaria borealis TaxID=47425 RepID=A0AA39K3Q4_9AGAR|nr:hypothetical protein EV421DRAFT_1767517 [Armillaria borealis]